MGNESEPRLGQEDNTPPFLAEEQQLQAFIEELDVLLIKNPPIKEIKLPDFLRRDGVDGPRSVSCFILDQDLKLLMQHTETHKEALELRDQIAGRIRPVEILEMVRDIWGGGVISTGGKVDGAAITYRYLKAVKEVGTYRPKYPETVSYETGRWLTAYTETRGAVCVRFPSTGSLTQDETAKFFPSIENVRGIGEMMRVPKTIWGRPDNLRIFIGLARPGKERGQVWRFDQSSSQQEIKDFLAQKLEAQRVAGQLPSQMKALELAKIEELRKKGLLIEPKGFLETLKQQKEANELAIQHYAEFHRKRRQQAEKYWKESGIGDLVNELVLNLPYRPMERSETKDHDSVYKKVICSDITFYPGGCSYTWIQVETDPNGNIFFAGGPNGNTTITREVWENNDNRRSVLEKALEKAFNNPEHYAAPRYM